MNQARLSEVIDAARERQDVILKAKGADYTRLSEDRLANFKRSAEAFGLRPDQVWGIFFFKHIDAIATYIKSGGQSESEPIEGRIDDAHNYLYLFEALIKEDK